MNICASMTTRALSVAALVGLTFIASAAAQAPAGAQAPAQPQPAQPQPAAPTLSVGDSAPALAIDTWVRGEPVTGLEKGRVYVVEFWATWCGPCVRAIPHLTELHKLNADKGLTIVAVSGADKRGNTLEKVKEMVEAKNREDLMTYTVAWDRERATRDAWMTAAGQRGIPTAFIVDRAGKIAFIGSPYEMDNALNAILAGNWDLAKERARFEAVRAADQRYGSFIDAVRAGEYDKAAALAQTLVASDARDDSDRLNSIAWTIVDPSQKWPRRDLDLAIKAAERADELTKHADASVLDTLARCWFLKGDAAKAVQIQERALAVASNDMKKQLAAALGEYRKAAGK